MLHQRVAGAAVDDLAAVVAQDTTAVFFQFQFPGQRLNAHGGPPAGQHDAHAPARRFLQGRLGARRNDLVAVGQRAVQVQCQNFILHTDFPRCLFVTIVL